MAALFEWSCPTFGCRGLVVTEREPVYDSRAVCTRRQDGGDPFCGREMRWSASAWVPVSPFRGFG